VDDAQGCPRKTVFDSGRRIGMIRFAPL
jgi:hypothetical protein